jgi:hypothetical protein
MHLVKFSCMGGGGGVAGIPDLDAGAREDAWVPIAAGRWQSGCVLRCGCREHVAGKLRVREARFRVLWWMPFSIECGCHPFSRIPGSPISIIFQLVCYYKLHCFFNMSGSRKFVSVVFHAPHICFFFLPQWFIYLY